jgi:hypothetical protein
VELFIGHGFNIEGDIKFYLKFYMKKEVHFIYRLMPWMLGFGGWINDFWGH